MNYNKFFEIAKAKGVNESELSLIESTNLSFSLFHGEIDSYESSSTSTYFVRGLINGKFGACVSDVYDSKKALFMVQEMIDNAKTIEKNEPNMIFKGSPKYKKVKTYNPKLDEVSTNKKIELLHQLEKAIKEKDKRISEVAGVFYSESTSIYKINNSFGLKLSQKSNVFEIGGEAVAKDKEQTKTGSFEVISNNIDDININEIANEIAKNALEQLNGTACETGKYKAVLDNKVVNALMNVLISYASSELVQKQSSLFIGKLHQKVANRKITISDKPLAKSIFARGFDDEGVATYNKDIIKNGVLETYLYNLRTAAKDGVTTTGNGYGGGSKMGVSPCYTVMKPGKKSLDELFTKMENGVYITGVQGLHCGLNRQSGNFSLQAEGFMVENGKKTHPLDIITISSNILDVFNSVIEVGNDVKEHAGSSCPSILIKKIAVSGK